MITLLLTIIKTKNIIIIIGHMNGTPHGNQASATYCFGNRTWVLPESSRNDPFPVRQEAVP